MYCVIKFEFLNGIQNIKRPVTSAATSVVTTTYATSSTATMTVAAICVIDCFIAVTGGVCSHTETAGHHCGQHWLSPDPSHR